MTNKYYLPASPYGFHVATLGMNGLVAHLNFGDGITGTILQRKNGTSKGMVAFRPDGWLLPPGVWPEGFQIDADNLIPYEGDERMPVRYATPLGEAVPAALAQRLVREFIEHASPWVFTGTTRDAALGALTAPLPSASPQISDGE